MLFGWWEEKGEGVWWKGMWLKKNGCKIMNRLEVNEGQDGSGWGVEERVLEDDTFKIFGDIDIDLRFLT